MFNTVFAALLFAGIVGAVQLTTLTTTFNPMTTDYATQNMATYTINAETYAADPSDNCHGGVITFNITGEVVTAVEIGLFFSQAAMIAGTHYNDYSVYETIYNTQTGVTTITALLCLKTAFDKTIASMKSDPTDWVVINNLCNLVVYPDGVATEICVRCFDGEFLYEPTQLCYACSPITTLCIIPEVLVCTGAADSTCAIPCDPKSPGALTNCMTTSTYCSGSFVKCLPNGCVPGTTYDPFIELCV